MRGRTCPSFFSFPGAAFRAPGVRGRSCLLAFSLPGVACPPPGCGKRQEGNSVPARDRRRSSDPVACDPTAGCVASRPMARTLRGAAAGASCVPVMLRFPTGASPERHSALSPRRAARSAPDGAGGYERSRLRHSVSGSFADPISTPSRLDPRLARECGLGLEVDLQQPGFVPDNVAVSFRLTGGRRALAPPGRSSGPAFSAASNSRISGSRARYGVLTSGPVAAGAAVWRPLFGPECNSGKR